MKCTFIHNGIGWWLKISTIEEMCDYFNVEWERRKLAVLEDKQRVEKKYHSSNYLTSAIDILVNVHKESFESTLDKLQKQLYKDWYQSLCDGKTIYVNGVGGYCFTQDVKKVYKKDGYDFPVFSESDIRIKRWPGGKHYYAYIGDMQVTDGQNLKWDTEKEAKEIARCYITKRV